MDARFGTKHAYLLAGLGPLLVMAAASFLFEWAGPAVARAGFEPRAFLPPPGTPSAPTAVFGEAQSRFAWLTTVLLNLFVSIFAIGTFVGIVSRSLGRRGRIKAAVAATVLCGAGVAFLLHNIGTEGALHRIIYDFTFETLQASGRFNSVFLGRVSTLLSLVNVLAVVAPALALVACVSTVAPLSGASTSIAELRLRSLRLKEAVNASAALLVSGILHMGAWLRWPAPLLPDQSARQGAEHLALAVTLFWGMAFSLMIAGAFLPANGVLRARAWRLFQQTAEARTLDPDKWLMDQGFKLPIGRQLPQIAVMLAPLLAGPIASMFNSITSWAQ